MRIIWGKPQSLDVMKLCWLLEELRTPYARRDVPAPGPRPALLQDDGFALNEPHAALRFLSATVPGANLLYPADAHQRARIDQLLDWQLTRLEESMGRLAQWTLRTPKHLQADELVARSLAAAASHLAILESALAEHAGLCGDALSLADIAAGPLVHRWFTLPVERPAMPRLAAYHDVLMARPAFARVMAARAVSEAVPRAANSAGPGQAKAAGLAPASKRAAAADANGATRPTMPRKPARDGAARAQPQPARLMS